MISERIEAQDLKEYKNMMSNRLSEFREEWNELKHLQLDSENHSEQMIYLIKSEVIDLADRFDVMQDTLARQSQMLEILLRKNLGGGKEQQNQHNGSEEQSEGSYGNSIERSYREETRGNEFAVVETEDMPSRGMMN